MQGEGPVGPVFVDPTGRRARVLARACWALGAVMVAYVALVIVSLAGPPGLSRLTVPGLGPVLPGPAAAPLGTASGGRQRAERVLVAPSSPSPRSESPAPSVRPSRTPASVPPSPRPAAPSARPSTSAIASPSPAPSPVVSTRPGQPQASPRPSPMRTPRGQASVEPSPRNTRTPPRPSRSPR